MVINDARISVIIRFKNEAALLDSVLQAVRAQCVPGAFIRIIGVDNGSDDGSHAIAERYCDRILEIDDYMPGAAINLAMRVEPCDFAAVLSAHCLPSSEKWLSSLMEQAALPNTLCVYGAQLYPINSRFLDKRDLDLFSTRISRLEVRDSDFWNANSMFSRQSWESLPFDETTFEMEDHYWTKCQLDGSNCVRFVPDALVYHYGHLSRNDRTFVPNTITNKGQLIGTSIATLSNRSAPWPDLMMAALTIKSLWIEPAARAAIPVLIQQLASNCDFDIRWRVAGTLGKLPHPGGVDQLIEALNDPSFYVRDEAAWALAEIGETAAAALLERIGTISEAERPLAALALGRSGSKRGQEEGLELIRQGLSDLAGTLHLNYAYSAGEMAGVPGASTLLPSLITLLGARSAAMRAVAAWALGSLAADYQQGEGWTILTKMADGDDDALVRTEAVIALGKVLMFSVNSRAIEALSRAVADRDSRVRYAAVQSSRLLAESTEMIIPMMKASARDEDNGVRLELKFLEARLANKNSPVESRKV